MSSEQPLHMTSKNTDLGLYKCSASGYYIIQMSGKSWLYVSSSNRSCAELYVPSLINALDTEVLV